MIKGLSVNHLFLSPLPVRFDPLLLPVSRSIFLRMRPSRFGPRPKDLIAISAGARLPSLICAPPDGFVQLVVRLLTLKLRLQELCLGFRLLCNRPFGLGAQMCTPFELLR